MVYWYLVKAFSKYRQMEQEEGTREKDRPRETESRLSLSLSLSLPCGTADGKLVSTRVTETFGPPSSFHSRRDLERASSTSGNHRSSIVYCRDTSIGKKRGGGARGKEKKKKSAQAHAEKIIRAILSHDLALLGPSTRRCTERVSISRGIALESPSPPRSLLRYPKRGKALKQVREIRLHHEIYEK